MTSAVLFRARSSILLPGIVGLLLALVVVRLHLLALGDDPSIFVRAAPPQADAQHVPASLRVMHADQAYDGMFFYRLAVDPLAVRDVGITLDNPGYRQQRILYPLLVWGVSGGREIWVPWMLVTVNVAGLALLGMLGALFARGLGQPAWWGIGLPIYPGFTFTLARDLSEIVQASLLIGTLLAVKGGRIRWAACLMALAILARETALILSVAMLIASLVYWLTSSPRRFQAATLAVGLAGICCYAVVQLVLGMRWGVAPVVAGSGNLAAPLSAPLQYLSSVGRLGWVEVAWFVGLVAAALLTRDAPAYLRLALIGYLVLLVSLAPAVWTGDAAWLRAATEASLLSWLLLFCAGRRRVLPALIASAGLWPFVARWAIGT